MGAEIARMRTAAERHDGAQLPLASDPATLICYAGACAPLCVAQELHSFSLCGRSVAALSRHIMLMYVPQL